MLGNTKSLLRHLDSLGIVYRPVERERKSDLVILKYRLDKGHVAEILFFFERDNSNVSLRCYTGLRADRERETRALELINRLNPEYRCAKFFMDDGEIVAACDFMTSGEDTGAFCYKYLELFIYVINEVYDEFVKIIL